MILDITAMSAESWPAQQGDKKEHETDRRLQGHSITREDKKMQKNLLKIKHYHVRLTRKTLNWGLKSGTKREEQKEQLYS